MIPWCFDLESHLIQPGQTAPPPVCVQWSYDGIEADFRHLNPAVDRSGWQFVEERIHDPNTLLVGHHTFIDLAMICAARPDLIPAVFQAYQNSRVTDTLLRQKLIDIAEGVDDDGWITVHGERQKVVYDLGTTASRWAPIQLDKKDPWRKQYGTLYWTPCRDWPEEAVRYLKRDANGTALAYHGQEAAKVILADQFRQSRAGWWIGLMGAWGVRTDRETVRQAELETLREVETDRDRLYQLGLVRRDGSKDTKAAAQRMLNACLRLQDAPPITKAGLKELGIKSVDQRGAPTAEQLLAWVTNNPDKLSLDEDACIGSGDSDLEAYARFTSSSTMLKKIRRLYKGTSTPLQPSFESLKATGRTSCRQGVKVAGKEEEVPSTWGTQLQNPPKDGPVRECVIPRKGFKYGDIDYEGFELASWGQVCKWITGKSAMVDAINANRNAHTLVAVTILEQPYEFVLEALKGLHGPEWKAKAGDARQSGKIANFGYQGGMGPATLKLQARKIYRVEITLEKAKYLKQVWLETWPEAKLYLNWISRSLHEDTGLTVIKHFLSDRIRGGIPYTVAANTLFQGLAADAAKDAGFRIAREMYVDHGTPLFGSRLVNFVHDQFVAEVPELIASEATLRMDTIMRETASEWMPDVTIRTTPAITSRWYKGAEPVWSPDRKTLLEWYPKAA